MCGVSQHGIELGYKDKAFEGLFTLEELMISASKKLPAILAGSDLSA